MSRMAEHIIRARDTAPVQGADFDAWLLDLILEALEPAQRDILGWLLIGENRHVPVSTNDLCIALETTPTRIGVTLSRLRRIGLIKTTYEQDEHGRYALHVAAPWVQGAEAMRIQIGREMTRSIFR